MTNVYTGKPVPFDGRRQLTGKEALQRAAAMKCIRSRKAECQGQVAVGIFFDGTGNNEKWKQEPHTLTQRERNKHSNVSRLFDTHISDVDHGFIKIYVPGVGTPFADIGDTWSFRTENVGNGFAYMGADRINWAIATIFENLHRYSTGKLTGKITAAVKKKMVEEMSEEILMPGDVEGRIRWSVLTAVEEYIEAVIHKEGNRKIIQINISVFGFSRGAAQARAFVHWLNHIFEGQGGGFIMAGVPVRINFLGIFDTVAAVGVGDVTPVTFGHMAWGKDTQSIHASVEECAHFIALHEQRGSFPLESATGRGNTGYPGMHSDVGGGYCPGEQGKSRPDNKAGSPHLSQIPLLDMHFAALKAGVPMLTINEINKDVQLRRAFEVHPDLLAAYNSWLDTSGIKGGSVKQFTQAHCRQYLRWRGMTYLDPHHHLEKQTFFTKSSAQDKIDLKEANDDFGIMLKSWRERREANSTFGGKLLQGTKEALRQATIVFRPFVDRYDDLSKHEQQFYRIFTEGAVPPASITLFRDYVHDSRAGFRIVGNHEPFWLTGGYARYRNVFLQTPADARVYAEYNSSLKQVKSVVGSTVDYFQGLYTSTVNRYDAARRRVYREAKKAAEDVRDGIVEGGRMAGEAAEQTGKQIKQSAVRTGRAVRSGATYAGKKTRDAAVESGVVLEKVVNETSAAIERQSRAAMRQANQHAQLYSEAQNKVMREYVAAEKEWKRQLKERWNDQ